MSALSYTLSGRPAGWGDQQSALIPQQAGVMPQQIGGIPLQARTTPTWTSQYYTQDPNYARFFEAGDFTRTGLLDSAGLQAALVAAGEPSFDPETIELMIMMFDVDHNQRIDYNEFTALMNYVNSMKYNYSAAAAANGGYVGSRDASMIMSNTHGNFMNDIGGPAAMERGILPTVNPTQQGFFSFGNIVKIAIIVGVLRTLYEHNKLPFFSNQNSSGQAMGQQQQQYGGGYSQQQYGGQYGYGGVTQQGMTQQQTQTQPQKSHGILGRIFSSFGHNKQSY